jgi:LmbE family N-acetylglucosaminyl deacetylase
MIAFRPNSEWIEDFYGFYTASSTEWGYPRNFVPDTWIDITAVLDRKIAAFEAYESEKRAYPHPRSSEALRHQSHFWGNQCCMDAAEVLMTVRRIKR